MLDLAAPEWLGTITEWLAPHSKTIEWAGAVAGLIGAALLALNNRFSGWGFAAFLASNLLIITFGLLIGAYGIVTMQLGFTATSIVGLRRWPLPIPEVSANVVVGAFLKRFGAR